MRLTPLIALIGVLALPASALEREELGCAHGRELHFGPDIQPRAFDPETGRSTIQYAPDLIADYTHLKIEADVDLENKRLVARETLSFAPIAYELSSLTLDAVGLDIERVGDATGNELRHYHDGNTITVYFPQPLPPGREASVVFDYGVENPPAGLYFVPADDAHPGLPAILHSQGEDVLSRYWYIAHDYPNDRLTTELIVTVDKPNQVVSNGRLVSTEDLGDRTRWHWRQDQPHVNYLVSLCVGQWDVVREEWRGKPVEYYVPLGRGEDAKRTYGRTPEMLELFSRLFGEEYPWDKYAQVVVRNFNWGGMENTSATTMWEGAILDQVALLDGDMDGLISHELAHQWFGDLITCESWEHIWLNEGFATFSEALWFEHRDGWDDYLIDIDANMSGVAWSDTVDSPFPLVFRQYQYPDHLFSLPGANPYPKGASILAMLRQELGDEVFFKGLRHYVQTHKFTQAETHNFREAMERVSGRNLRWFFDQWCHRPGTPRVAVDFDFDAESGSLRIEVEQTQRIDEDAPAFRFTLPIWIRTESGERMIEIPMNGRSASHVETLDAPVVAAVVDPNLRVLKRLDVDMPIAWWRHTFTSGPTVLSRMKAAEHLARHGNAADVDRFAAVLLDSSRHHRLRRECADALATEGSDAAAEVLRRALDEGAIDDARVRESAINALARFEDERDVPLFAEHAEMDISYDCTRAALRALGRLDAVEEHFDLFARAVQSTADHESIRQTALDVLADFDDPRSLELMFTHAAFGNAYRTRPVAIRGIARLAHHDPDRALEVLVGFLDDPEERTFTAALDALADLGDERAVEPLQRIADRHPLPWYREWAQWSIDRINDKAEESATASN